MGTKNLKHSARLYAISIVLIISCFVVPYKGARCLSATWLEVTNHTGMQPDCPHSTRQNGYNHLFAVKGTCSEWDLTCNAIVQKGGGAGNIDPSAILTHIMLSCPDLQNIVWKSAGDQTADTVLLIDCVTAAPTPGPTVSPTQPTASPTQYPTVETAAPTAAPSETPTVSPTETTRAPTISPTESPSTEPSDSPTRFPTASPTESPSVNPSASPTKTPTNPPTIAPSRTPTKATTKRPTAPFSTAVHESSIRLNVSIPLNISPPDSTQTITGFVAAIIAENAGVDADQITLITSTPQDDNREILQFGIVGSEDEVDNVEHKENDIKKAIEDETGAAVMVQSFDKTYGEKEEQPREEVAASDTTLILVTVLAVLCVLLLAAYIHAGWVDKNDYFNIGGLFTASMHVMDMLSDILFAVDVPNIIITPICVTFIIVPVLINLYQLFVAIVKWQTSDRVSNWLSNNVYVLYMFSSITGGAFAAVSICTSNAFGLSATSMPLNHVQIQQFKTKRVYSTVLFENIPQLCVQVWVLSAFRDAQRDSNIVYIAMALSSLSIIITFLSIFSQRSIIRSRDYVSISMDITGSVIIAGLKTCLNRRSSLHAQIAGLLGLDQDLIEIERPTQIKQGLRVQINFYINNTRAIDLNLEREMKSAHQSGQLAEILKASWKLFEAPLVTNIQYEMHASKERRDNTEVIRVDRIASQSDVSGNRAHSPRSVPVQNTQMPMNAHIAMSALPPVIQQPVHVQITANSRDTYHTKQAHGQYVYEGNPYHHGLNNDREEQEDEESAGKKTDDTDIVRAINTVR